jgi:single-strand selective monofunctional uracil DNA glycosylase
LSRSFQLLSSKPQEPAPQDVDRLIRSAQRLNEELLELRFSSPITHVYNPLSYAWAPHEAYLRRFGAGPKLVVFLGMNPGPFGMVQTGIPFGEVKSVREWLRIGGPVGKPPLEHPRRPITGFACKRSEVSGRRLWGLFAARFGDPEDFFKGHLVLNYCPLAFMEASGRNRTPDKLAGPERERLFAACDQHLREAIETLRPQWLIGVGEFARRRAETVFPKGKPKIGQILHPSPANPAANRAWPAHATRQLEALGVWAFREGRAREGRAPARPNLGEG